MLFHGHWRILVDLGDQAVEAVLVRAYRPGDVERREGSGHARAVIQTDL